MRARRCRPGFAPPGTLVVGSVGRVQPVKDQRTLLRAFAALGHAAPALAAKGRVVIVGEGPSLADLRALAASLGIESATWFAGSRGDVPALLRAFDLFVLPSLNEGISNTILEAMATGLPVIASAVGGNVELVDDGAGGALFPAGDTPALATVLERYLGDGALRSAQGECARARAAARFSLPAMVAGYQAVYEKLAQPAATFASARRAR